LAWSSVARADDAPSDPAQLKAQGDEAMVNNNYQEALDRYEAAYKITKSPALLYNQGRALQALNRLPEAFDMIVAFEATAPAELKAKVPKLAELKADLERRIAKVHVEVSEPGATIRLGDRVLGTSPLAEIRVNAGAAKIEVSKEGFATETRNVVLDPARALDLKVNLVPKDQSGLLVITSKVKGAHVSVDGTSVGDVPSEVQLRAGAHTVKFEARGYDDNQVEVVISAGKTKQLEMQPGAAPVYKQPWFWGTLGGIAATAAIVVPVVNYAYTHEKPADKGTITPGIVPVQRAPGSFTIHLMTPPIRF
jgi:hypothetical protein